MPITPDWLEAIGIWVLPIAAGIGWMINRYLRIKLEPLGFHSKDLFDNVKQPAYRMTVVVLANARGVDVRDARCQVRWRRVSRSDLHQRVLHGLWSRKIASGLVSASGVEEQTDLPGNGDTRHLGLCVRHPSGRVFPVCTETYHAGPQHPNYGVKEHEIEAGLYHVDVLIRAAGGKRGAAKLLVHHEGVHGTVIASAR
jgi:hypothetical protein